jgi:hypothetical protein
VKIGVDLFGQVFIIGIKLIRNGTEKMIVSGVFALAALLNLVVAFQGKDDRSMYLLATIVFGVIAFFAVPQ